MTHVIGHARSQEEALDLCYGCPKLCRHACPVSDADCNEATTPWGKMSAMKLMAAKQIPAEPETMALAYKCLECRLCQSNCDLDNPVASVLDAFRVQAFRTGTAPASVFEACHQFQDHNNPYRKDLLEVLQAKFSDKITKKEKTIYFPGCTEIARSPETIQNTFALLKRLGIHDVGLYPERIQCCGYPLYAAGDWDNFKELAEVVHSSLKEYRQIVSGSPECLYTLATLYRSVGVPLNARFSHILEFVEKPLQQAGLAFQDKKEVAYHDPCFLGRYRQAYEVPRKLIHQVTGKTPKEFSSSREVSYCCGAGGLLPVSSPETAAGVTRKRIAEFKNTGADEIVSACPMCVQRFREFGAKARNVIDYIVDHL